VATSRKTAASKALSRPSAEAARASSKRVATKRTKPDLRIAVPGSKAGDSAPFAHLEPTADPEVFVNKGGSLVDKHGVLLNLRASFDVRAAEAQLSRSLMGDVPDTPAKLLKFMALNPALPMLTRLDAAKAAAPYFDKKTPVAIENTNQDLTIDIAAVAKLPRGKRIELLRILGDLGVDIKMPQSASGEGAAP
jgi:hypothetical protein